MAAKADKDALKKNAFWIGLVVFLILWVCAVLFVMMAGDAGKEKAWKETKTAIEGAMKTPRNEKFFAPWDKYAEEASGHKDRVWLAGWNQQKDIYVWPDRMELKPNYPTDPWGNTPVNDLDRRSRFRDEYKEQFVGMDQQISPAVFKGGFAAVFPMHRWNERSAPTREEIWLAQEDFWLRKELLFIVQDAMNSVAVFKDVTAERLGKDSKLPDGVQGRKVFRNANWELDLLFVKATEGTRWELSADSTIKNVNRTQKLQPLASVSHPGGVPFRFSHPGTRGVVIRIAGEPLAYDQVAKIGRSYKLDPVLPARIFAPKDPLALNVSQVLEWETSPIRQLNAIELAYHSHRTVTWGLKINEDLKKLDPDPVVEGAAAGDPMGGSPAGGPPMGGPPASSSSGPGVGGSPGGSSAAAVDSTRINLIPRPRYMHITKQCKHIPIALQVIIDQNHIHDFLGAVANTPLRIQITQVAVTSVPTPARPNPLQPGGVGTNPGGEAGPGGEGAVPMPGVVGMPPGMVGGPATSGSAFGSRFGGAGSTGFRPGDDFTGSGGGSSTTLRPGETASQVVDTARMVELTVHGIATLYERYPPAPPPAEAPKQ